MQMALSEEVVCRVKSGRAVMNVTLVLGDHVAKGLPNKCKHWQGAMSKESNSEFRELWKYYNTGSDTRDTNLVMYMRICPKS